MRKLRIVLVLLALCVGLSAFNPTQTSTGSFVEVLGISPAYAQQAKKKKRRGLFKILFGRKKAKRKAVTKRRNKRRGNRRSRTRQAKRRAASRNRRTANRNRNRRVSNGRKVAASTVVVKQENAKKVLVIGDFLAGGLADGLEKRLADVGSIVVVDKSRGLSGFVRSDVIDWPARLKPLIEEHKPSYVVAMLGTNDRQQIRIGGKRYNKRLPEWDVEYAKRVTALGNVLKESGLPFSWVGLPPVRFKSMNKDFLYFNETYAKAAEAESGSFIDVWDGFADADGNYSRSGPDVNGQIVLLRPKGGINLTKAGKERLAYYVEAPILRALGGRAGPALAGADIEFSEPELPKPVEYDPVKTGKTVVIRLDDPSADGDQVLAGATINASISTVKPPVVPVLNIASRPVRREGRIDNYIWPPNSNGLPEATTSPVASIANSPGRPIPNGVRPFRP